MPKPSRSEGLSVSNVSKAGQSPIERMQVTRLDSGVDMACVTLTRMKCCPLATVLAFLPVSLPGAEAEPSACKTAEPQGHVSACSLYVHHKNVFSVNS